VSDLNFSDSNTTPQEIYHPEQAIRESMRQKEEQAAGNFPMARWSSLFSGLFLAVRALFRGGISGAVLGLFASLLTRRGTDKVALDTVPDPSDNPWWKRFTSREAARAKSQPITMPPSDSAPHQ
jgi:hypothetical protein